MRANPTLPRPEMDDEARRPLPLEDPTLVLAAPARPAAGRWWRWLRAHLPFAVVLVIATYLITLNVASPWQSMHEDNGTLNESIALNHLRYGLGVTKGQDLLDTEAQQSFGPRGLSEAQHFAYFAHGPTHPRVYGDHPPLLGLTIAGSFLIFGPHFWSERLVPIVYALLGLIVFYRLASQVFDLGVARCAACLYATFPMLAYFGRDVSHEAPTLFWALLLLTGYVQRRPALMAVVVVIGGLYGWPLYYFAVILWGVHCLAERRWDWRLARVTVLPAILTFAVVLAQLDWALGGDLARLSAMFAYRTGGSDHTATVTTLSWLQQVSTWNAEGFGGWSQLALPAAIFFLLAKLGGEGWSPRARVLAITALWGLSHVLLFRNGALIHAYWQFYLLPFYALVLGWAAVTLARAHIARPPLRAVALALLCFSVACLNLPAIDALYSTGYQVTLPVVPLFDLWR